MGDHFEAVVDTEVAEGAARALAERVRSWLVARGVIGVEPAHRISAELIYPPGPRWFSVCERQDGMHGGLSTGLEVTVGRTFFSCYENGPELTCTVCRNTFIPDDGYPELVGSWCEGNEAMMACPACGHEEQLTTWSGEWPDGFGNLGFTFWNGPPLSERFVEELGHFLGHRIRRVRGKL